VELRHKTLFVVHGGFDFMLGSVEAIAKQFERLLLLGPHGREFRADFPGSVVNVFDCMVGQMPRKQYQMQEKGYEADRESEEHLRYRRQTPGMQGKDGEHHCRKDGTDCQLGEESGSWRHWFALRHCRTLRFAPAARKLLARVFSILNRQERQAPPRVSL
jgi:hypothetical protein